MITPLDRFVVAQVLERQREGMSLTQIALRPGLTVDQVQYRIDHPEMSLADWYEWLWPGEGRE